MQKAARYAASDIHSILPTPCKRGEWCDFANFRRLLRVLSVLCVRDTNITYFVQARRLMQNSDFEESSRTGADILLTTCDRGEWCRVCLFQTERDRRILCVCNSARASQIKAKYAPLYAVAYLKKSTIFCLITCNLPSINCIISLFLDFLNCSRCLSMSSFCIT